MVVQVSRTEHRSAFAGRGLSESELPIGVPLGDDERVHRLHDTIPSPDAAGAVGLTDVAAQAAP